jgi:hypothetical protein
VDRPRGGAVAGRSTRSRAGARIPPSVHAAGHDAVGRAAPVERDVLAPFPAIRHDRSGALHGRRRGARLRVATGPLPRGAAFGWESARARRVALEGERRRRLGRRVREPVCGCLFPARVVLRCARAPPGSAPGCGRGRGEQQEGQRGRDHGSWTEVDGSDGWRAARWSTRTFLRERARSSVSGYSALKPQLPGVPCRLVGAHEDTRYSRRRVRREGGCRPGSFRGSTGASRGSGSCRNAAAGGHDLIRGSAGRPVHERGGPCLTRVGRLGKCRSPIHASAAMCVATSSTGGLRDSVHHCPTNVTIPISACA